MRVFPRIRRHDESSNVNFGRLKVQWKSMGILDSFIGNSIVSNQWICEYQNLPTIGGIREGFGVAHHASIENHFARHRDRGSKGTSFNRTRTIG
jgi:hypothetical protein